MTKPEIELRRQQLSEEYLALPYGWSARGLEICEEFGPLAEEKENCGGASAPPQFSKIVKAEVRSR